jgi:hypothetical protein
MLRTVTIDPVLNGWIVTIGCQRVVFSDKDLMLGEIGRYLECPDRVEEEYRRDAVNAKHTFQLQGMVAVEEAPQIAERDWGECRQR